MTETTQPSTTSSSVPARTTTTAIPGGGITSPPPLDNPPATVDEAFQRLTKLGTARALSAEIDDDGCAVLDEVDADGAAPLGSAFSLYVLAALGSAVESGTLSWEDQIVIRDELKSIPPGELQDRPDGTTVSVLEAAKLMISISDNTASDHIIDLLGRNRIEQALRDHGNQNAELTTPFPGTRELTALKIGPAEGLRRPGWVEGDEAERRAILDQVADISTGDLPIEEWVEPIDPDVVEWFASPIDMCRLAVDLLAMGETMPEIGDILEINPGITAESDTWDRIWFKGGSEPGLLTGWWVTEKEGRNYVTMGSVVDGEMVIDSDEAILLLAAARDLLAQP